MKVRDTGRKLQFPLILALMLLPAVLFCCRLAEGADCLAGGLAVLALYTALAELCLLVPGKARLIAGIAGSVLLAAAAVCLLPITQNALTALPVIAEIALLLWGLRMAAWSSTEELHPAFAIVGVTLDLIVSFMASRTPLPDKSQLQALVLGGFLGLMLLALLSASRSNVLTAANNTRPPRFLRQRNTIITVCMMALVTLIASAPVLARWLSAAWEAVVEAVKAVFRWLSSLLSTSNGGEEPAGERAMLTGLAEEGEPSLIWMILEKVAMALAALVILWLLWKASGVIMKALRRLYAKLMALLQRYGAASSEDYVDEIESTREGEKGEVLARASRRRRIPRLNEAKLTPREKVRYRYLRQMVRTPDWTEAQTVREQLSAPAAELYERARYSEHDITPEEAEAFLTEKKKA